MVRLSQFHDYCSALVDLQEDSEADGMKQMKKPAKIRHANFYSMTLLAMCFGDTMTIIDTEFEM